MLITITLILVTLSQAPQASGSTTLRSGLADRPDWSTTINTSQTRLFADSPSPTVELPKSTSAVDRHTVYQLQDLPAPGDVLDLPSPRQFDRDNAPVYDKPATLDYIFMSRASVKNLDTNFLVNQVGFDYRLTRPFFRTQAALTFRPAAEIMFLSGPGGGIELPEQLYKIAFDFQLDIPFNEVFGVSLGITPGLWSDLIVIDGADFRLPARVLLTYRVNDSLFLAGGLIYTDNIRQNLLPGLGVIWDPNEKWHLEILYPRSRIVYRWNEDIAAYFVFERGGTTYNIREFGQDEDFEYRDLRTLLGLEYNRIPRFGLFVELGVAFDRKFRFDIQGNFDLGDSFILRAGTRF
ncbi:hypothetical protein K2X85_03675 [bacterium]|nr:hypothetical protein [bacterium]